MSTEHISAWVENLVGTGNSFRCNAQEYVESASRQLALAENVGPRGESASRAPNSSSATTAWSLTSSKSGKCGGRSAADAITEELKQDLRGEEPLTTAPMSSFCW